MKFDALLVAADKEKLSLLLATFFTNQEREDLDSRVRIVGLLLLGMPQRKIAEELGVGIATVTKWSKKLREVDREILEKVYEGIDYSSLQKRSEDSLGRCEYNLTETKQGIDLRHL